MKRATPQVEPARRPSSTAAYWLFASHLWLLFGIALSNITLGLALLSAPWSRQRRPLPEPARPLLLALAAYVLLLAASIFFSYDPRTSLAGFGDLFTLAAVPLGLMLVRGQRQARRIVDYLILMSVVVAALGLTQYLAGLGDMHHRIRGPLSHYMTFAGILMMANLLLLARILYRPAGRRLRAAQGLGLAILTVALLGSYTRSAWLGMTIGAAILVVMSSWRRWVVLLPVVLAAAVLLSAPVRQRVGSIADLNDPSNYDRICMAKAGLTMIAERPLFGIGPNLVDERYPIYRHPTAPRYWVPHLHNSFIQLAAERGLPELLAYGLMMALSLAASWRRWRAEGRRQSPRADLLLGSFAGLIAFNVAGLFEHNWGDTEVQRLALFLLILPFISDQDEATERG